MTRSTRIGAAAALLLIAASASWAESPKPATDMMAAAMRESKASKKAVMVIFGASWCGWCKRLDALMSNKEYQNLFTDNYVVVHLDVMEQPEKKSLENEGADRLMKELGGAESGLPFFAILDAKGKKLADANALPGGKNIGYPSAPEEIVAFEEILKKTAPKLSAADRGRLITHLQKTALH